MNAREFVQTLCSLEFANTFNPYIHRCPIHDLDDAPIRRRKALLAILEAAVGTEVDALWVGRDLGHRGGRRTGLALTDDIHMQAHAERWRIAISRATQGPLVAERTAAVIWSVLAKIRLPIFLWNVFPLHPHESSDPFSNRSHNATERKAGEETLTALVALLRPRRIIAIGNDAAHSAFRLSSQIEIAAVRHPSYGGQTRFLCEMCALYSLPRPVTRDLVL
jgi:hypothetical protein